MAISNIRRNMIFHIAVGHGHLITPTNFNVRSRRIPDLRSYCYAIPSPDAYIDNHPYMYFCTRDVGRQHINNFARLSDTVMPPNVRAYVREIQQDIPDILRTHRIVFQSRVLIPTNGIINAGVGPDMWSSRE